MAAATQAQPPTQREGEKELRSSIRGLLSRARHDRHNLISADNNGIVKLVEESNEYVDKVTRPRDQAVDAEFFNFVTEAGLEFVTRMKQGGRAYSAGDFLRRLKTRFVDDLDAQVRGAEDPDAFNWAGLGQLPAVSLLFRTVPVVHHMLGPMDAQPRQRRQVQRQARRRLPTGEAVRPEEVDNLGEQEKQETDRNMEEMFRTLVAAGGRVTLLDLVMNHDSFAQTTENLFTLSFLVRDGNVALEPNEEQGMIVQKLNKGKPDAAGRGADERERVQFVVPLDIEAWEQWKKVVDPAKPPMMKHRKEWHQQAAAEAAAAAAAMEQEEQAEEEAAGEQQQEAPGSRRRSQQPRRRQQSPANQEESPQQVQQQAEPAAKRRKARGEPAQEPEAAEEEQEEEEEEPAAPPAKRRQQRAQQAQQAQQPSPAQQQKQQKQKQKQQVRVKQEKQQQQQQQVQVKAEPASAPRQRAQQAQHQITIIEISSDDSDVIVISDSEEEAVQQAAVLQPAQQTQQTQQQSSGRHAPIRGKKRAAGQP